MPDMGRPLTPEESTTYHFHVGAVMRSWVHLEFALMFHLQILLHTDQWRTRVVWNSLPNFRARLNLIARLVETFVDDEETLTEFKAIRKKLKVLARNRNMLAHSIGGNLDTRNRHVFLVDDNEDGKPMEFAGKRAIQGKSIAQWHREMQQMRHDLQAFLRDRIDPNMLASPRKRP